MEQVGFKLLDISISLFISAIVIYGIYKYALSEMAKKDVIIANKDTEIARLQTEQKEEIRQNQQVLIKASDTIGQVIASTDNLKADMIRRLEELKDLINRTIVK